MANTGTAHLMPFPVLLRRLWQHVTPRRKRQIVLLTGLILVSAFAEIVSLGAVLPFLGILTSPAKVLAYPAVANFMRAWGIVSPDRLVLPFAAAFALAAVLAGAFRLLVLWISSRIAFATGSDFSSEVYRRTLYQPYWVQVTSNSSDVISGITGKISDTVVLLSNVLTLLISSVVLVFITATLFAIDPLVASIAITGFGACYGLMTAIDPAPIAARQSANRIRTYAGDQGTPRRTGRHSRRAARWNSAGLLRNLSKGRPQFAAGAGRHRLRRRQPEIRHGGDRHGVDCRARVRRQPASGRRRRSACRPSVRWRWGRSACSRRCSKPTARGRTSSAARRR